MGDSSLESTEQVLSTPFLSQVPPSMDSHIWGFLQPLSPALKRIDFWKSLSVYDIGRNPDVNIIILPGLKISAYGKKKKSTSPAAPPFHAQPHYTHAGSKHARISWDGQSNKHATVILQDLSSNGTFVRLLHPLVRSCLLGCRSMESRSKRESPELCEMETSWHLAFHFHSSKMMGERIIVSVFACIQHRPLPLSNHFCRLCVSAGDSRLGDRGDPRTL